MNRSRWVFGAALVITCAVISSAAAVIVASSPTLTSVCVNNKTKVISAKDRCDRGETRYDLASGSSVPGPSGPPGASGASLKVYDANQQFVGYLLGAAFSVGGWGIYGAFVGLTDYPQSTVLNMQSNAYQVWSTAAGSILIIDVNGQVVANDQVYFESSDCSGTAYVAYDVRYFVGPTPTLLAAPATVTATFRDATGAIQWLRSASFTSVSSAHFFSVRMANGYCEAIDFLPTGVRVYTMTPIPSPIPTFVGPLSVVVG